MPEVKEQYIHIPANRKKKGNELRTITITEGVKALYDPKRKVIVTYLFDIKKYTMKEAKKWVKRHKDSASHLQVAELQSLQQGWGKLYDEESRKEIIEETLEALKNNVESNS